MKTDIVATQTLDSGQRIHASGAFISRFTRGLRRPSLLLVTGAVIVVAGMALNWDWLAAMGAAPIILSLAPCALMCTVGICCRRTEG